MRKFREFEEAREFVRSLNIKGQTEWREYSKSGKRPHDIPGSPDQTYKGKGWKGWGDFFGTGNISTVDREFLPFEEARKFVRSLNFKCEREWKEYSKSGKRPHDIPGKPNQIYKDKGWKGLGDWLGTGTIATFNRDFLPYEQAREFVRSLKLKNQTEWQEYSKSGQKPHNIPSSPHITYKGKGWMGYGDWLGTGNIAPFNREFLSFEEAREVVRNLSIKSDKQWKEYSKSGKRPHTIPSAPNIVYKGKGWKGWGDFFGTGNISTVDREFLPFEEARKFVRSLKFKCEREWKEYSKSGQRPHNIPSSPNQVYKGEGWKGMGNWLGADKNNYTLTKKEVQVAKDINNPISLISRFISKFNRIRLLANNRFSE